MKIRCGFVSNSSSSSFLVVFPKHIGGANNMGKLLFRGDWKPDEKVSLSSTPEDDDPTQLDIANKIYSDYCIGKRKSPEELRDDIYAEFNNILWDRWRVYDELDIGNIPADVPTELLNLIIKEIELNNKANKCIKNGEIQNNIKIQEEIRESWALQGEIIRKIALEKTDAYLKTHSEYIILCLEYSDNDGVLESTIEHGSVFDNLIHQRSSHH